MFSSLERWADVFTALYKFPIGTDVKRERSRDTLFSPVEPRKIQTRRMLMSRNIMRISLLTIFVAILHMSLVPTVWGQDERICSTAKAAGEWGYVYTGTLLLPTGPAPVAAVGRYTLDKEGNISGEQTRTVAPGEAAQEVIKGTGTVNDDCTGTATISVYDQSGRTLLRTAVLAAVYVHNQREVRYLFESLVLSNGTSIRVVVTADAKRVFSKD